jgi:uncharacterized PurR-regulated membrane protein YhhQ (DUF165 family)
LSAVWFGPWATPVNALLFIGLDLTARDSLHDAWKRRGLVWKMASLIVAGSLLTVALNRGAGRIALASCAAFALAAASDTLTYALLGNRMRLVRVNGSNAVSAAVDSVVFPWIAFGGFAPWVTLAQFGAKVVGGWLWSLVLMPREAAD